MDSINIEKDDSSNEEDFSYERENEKISLKKKNRKDRNNNIVNKKERKIK